MTTTTKASRADGGRVLIVDDDPDAAEAIGDCLARDQYSCELVLSGPAALDALKLHPFDIVISDVQMDGMNGLELLDRLTRTHPALPIIMVTGASRLAGAVEATKRGAFQYLAKPFDADVLREVVAQAIAARDRRSAPRIAASPPAASFPELSGADPAMVALRATIALVSASSAPVLIQGETGVGKELVAHSIHARGPRAERPFVAVNVASIPEQLLESELFGHVRGAYTGANVARRGLVVEADRGTLLLDEMGDMPLALQAKLLRVLQLGELRAVGSDAVRTVDVRVIASTHRDLPALVETGRFREDLFYRLDVLPIFVPPLRERRGDIPALATHFLEEARTRTPGSPVRAISPEAVEILSAASWPGNVRQLASTMERLVVFGRAETIAPQDISNLSGDLAARSGAHPALGTCTLKELSEEHVARVMTLAGGNKARAAEILGVNLSTLYRWQKRGA